MYKIFKLCFRIRIERLVGRDEMVCLKFGKVRVKNWLIACLLLLVQAIVPVEFRNGLSIMLMLKLKVINQCFRLFNLI